MFSKKPPVEPVDEITLDKPIEILEKGESDADLSSEQPAIATLRIPSKPSIISEGFEFVGTITSEGTLNIAGVVKGKITAKELEIKNDGVTVASIDATGSATLSSLQLPKNAGSSTIPEGENEVKVYNSSLGESSLIYITPETNPTVIDRPLVVKNRRLCTSSDEGCVNYFSVAMSTNNHPDLKFNWLIIN